jgi:hypothetical protein
MPYETLVCVFQNIPPLVFGEVGPESLTWQLLRSLHAPEGQIKHENALSARSLTAAGTGIGRRPRLARGVYFQNSEQHSSERNHA